MTRRHRAKVMLMLLALIGCSKVHSNDTLGLRDLRSAMAGRAGSAGQGTGSTTHTRIDAGSKQANQGVAVGSMPKDAAIAGSGAAAETLATGAGGGSRTDAGPSRAAPEVWIGQLRSTEPALCDPKPTSGVFVPDPAGYTERVVLILQHDGAAGLSGRIQFGDAAKLKAVPLPDAKNSDTSGFWKCSIGRPSQGAEYTLLAPVLTSERLTFAIVPNEVWNTWCTTQLGPCTDPSCKYSEASASCSCDGSTCRANQNVRIMIFLAVTADTIEGELSFGGRGLPADMRLRRVQ